MPMKFIRRLANCLTRVHENPESNPIVDSLCVCYKNHCSIQPLAWAAHPYWFNSVFYPPWDGKMSTNFRAE